MFQEEENIFFLYKNNLYNDNNIELNNYIDKVNLNLFPNKFKYYLSLNQNIDNKEDQEYITLEEINKIMNTPKINLDEDSYDEIYFINHSNIALSSSSIDSSTKISILPKNEKDIFNKIHFERKLDSKTGRNIKNDKKGKNKKFHSAEDFDNIQRKIQVHFISFLIKFGNDILKTIFGKKTKFNFKDVKYQLKKIVNHKYIENLKKCKYSDILQMKISPKNKNFGEYSNKETLIKVCTYSDKIKKIFDKNYLYIFQRYYCNIKNKKDSIDIDDMKITLSPKTKTLYNLLNKNEKIKDKIISAINDVYFSEIKYNNKGKNQKFVILPNLE